MLKLERTLLKCEWVGCDKPPSFKLIVYHPTMPSAPPALYCPEHSMEGVACFETNCKRAGMDYEVSA